MQAIDPAPTFRALFLDIDGTLIHASDHISPRVRKAIADAHERGCEVILCTGRQRFTAQHIAEQLEPHIRYLVSANGATAFHLPSSEVLYRRLLTIPLAVELARILVEVGTEPYVYEDATGEGVEAARVLYHPDLPVGPWAYAPRYRPYPAILEDLPFIPISVCAFGPPDRIRPLIPLLQERLPVEVRIIQSGSHTTWGIELYPADVSKQLGLEQVAAHLGLQREETMAIGDHINDLEMLAWAGLGVAMGNAMLETIATANVVTGSVEEDGVAQAIERFVLR